MQRPQASRAGRAAAQVAGRIGQQVRTEVVVDREALDRGQFKRHGGFARINKVFDGKLDAVLGDLHEEVWKDAG